MIRVLLCTTPRTLDELNQTWIMRGGIERQPACTLHDALAKAASGRPKLAVIDCHFPQALELAQGLRGNARTRSLPIAVLAPADIAGEPVRAFEEACNLLLRSPVTPEWGEGLGRLLSVEGRRDIRVPVRVAFVGHRDGSRTKVTGMAHNLSVSGLLLECVMHLPIDEQVELCLTLPGTDEELNVKGRVVRHQAPGTTTVSGYGVVLEELEPLDARRIRQFVTSASAQ